MAQGVFRAGTQTHPGRSARAPSPLTQQDMTPASSFRDGAKPMVNCSGGSAIGASAFWVLFVLMFSLFKVQSDGWAQGLEGQDVVPRAAASGSRALAAMGRGNEPGTPRWARRAGHCGNRSGRSMSRVCHPVRTRAGVLMLSGDCNSSFDLHGFCCQMTRCPFVSRPSPWTRRVLVHTSQVG